MTVVDFKPKAEHDAEQNVADFVRTCRFDLTVFGTKLDWGAWSWDGVGQFRKLGAPRASELVDQSPYVLDVGFVDFAKAYIRHEAGSNPGTRYTHTRRLGVLRAIEAAQLSRLQRTDPAEISLVDFDAAAQVLRDHFKIGITAYHVGLALEQFARFLARKKLTSTDTSSWRNTISKPKSLNRGVGKEADEERAKKMPSTAALLALGEMFNQHYNPNDPAQHLDIYTTSTVALLLSGPARGEEVHDLLADLEVEKPDSTGTMQYGWKFRASKGYGWDTKWIPAVWADIAKEAIQNIRAITDEPRKLAAYLEQQIEERERAQKEGRPPQLRFFRHSACPDLPDDQLLTSAQACAALGFTGKRTLGQNGLRQGSGTHTLNSLWNWVLDQLPAHFPYTSKARRLKYSEALFCMLRFQLHSNKGTSPVQLWKPRLGTLGAQLGGHAPTEDIFKRHRYADATGQRLKVTSHQFRHLLNTLAHEGSGDTFLSQEVIDRWSGRKDPRQGAVYNNLSPEKRATQVADLLKNKDGTTTVIGLPPTALQGTSPVPEQTIHWQVSMKPKPKSCEDLDLTPRGSNHPTLWGFCEHDFNFNPCEKFGDCLNCNEHHCIKGAGKDSQEKLERISKLLMQVQEEADRALAAAKRGDPGAAKWSATQQKYKVRLEQLVSILKNEGIAEGAVVRLNNSNAQSHLHRVLRSVAMDALEGNSAPPLVMRKMLDALGEDRGVALRRVEPLALAPTAG